MASQPNWKLISKEEPNHGMFYVGHAQESVIEFELPPEQIPGVEYLANKLAEATAKSIQENGGKILRLEVYMDKGEWYSSRWLVKVNAHGSPLAWALILRGIVIALIALVGIIVLSNTLLEVKDEWWIGPVMIVGGGAVALVAGFLLIGGGGGKTKTVYVQSPKNGGSNGS